MYDYLVLRLFIKVVSIDLDLENLKECIGTLTSEARIGSKIVAVAVFDVNSVKKVIITQIVNTIAKSEIEPKTDS